MEGVPRIKQFCLEDHAFFFFFCKKRSCHLESLNPINQTLRKNTKMVPCALRNLNKNMVWNNHILQSSPIIFTQFETVD
jgi:hypothetical protein